MSARWQDDKEGGRMRTNRHENATQTDVRAQSLAYPCALPKNAHQAVHDDLLATVCRDRPPPRGRRAAILQRGRGRDVPMLAAVEKSREDLVHVGAGADEEEDDQQQRLEVEEGRLEEGKRGLARGLKQAPGAQADVTHHDGKSVETQCASGRRGCYGARLWECGRFDRRQHVGRFGDFGF